MKVATQFVNAYTPSTAPRIASEARTTVQDEVTLGATESRTATILKTAAKGAAVGAVLGTASGLAYSNMDLHSVTAAHVGTILAGGAAGSFIIGKELQPKVEAPAAYALGAVAGAGFTWGTTAFGLLQNPVVSGIAGAALGGFYGGIGAFISTFKPETEGAVVAGTEVQSSPVRIESPTQQPAPPAQAPADPQQPEKLPSGMWKGMAVAYGIGGAALAAKMTQMAINGQITAGNAVGGAAVAGVALLNGYLIHKLIA